MYEFVINLILYFFFLFNLPRNLKIKIITMVLFRKIHFSSNKINCTLFNNDFRKCFNPT